MVMCEEAAARTLPRSLRVERQPRTTRWAMLTRMRAGEGAPRSRLFSGGEELVVLPVPAQAGVAQAGVAGAGVAQAGVAQAEVAQAEVEQVGIELESARLRVLGVRRDGQSLAAGAVPRRWLEPPRVGKLDHPALLWQLAVEGYWPATSEAHAEATALAHELRRRWDGADLGEPS